MDATYLNDSLIWRGDCPRCRGLGIEVEDEWLSVTVHEPTCKGCNEPQDHHPLPTVGAMWAQALRMGSWSTHDAYRGAPQQTWGAYHVEKQQGIGYTAAELQSQREYALSDDCVQDMIAYRAITGILSEFFI